GDTRSEFVVHHDIASFIGSDAGSLQTQILRVGNTSYGEQQVGAQDFRCAFLATNACDDFLPAHCHRNALRVEPDVYTFRLHDFTDAFGDIFIFTPDESRSHLNDRNFASEPAIHLSEFQPNITSTNDDEMIRHEVHIHHR